MPKTTEQNLIVCSGKSEASIASVKRLHSRHCAFEATQRHKASHALSATADLLEFLGL